MGQLVADSRFLTTSPYSSRVRSTGPKGSLPFFEGKPWIISGRDSNVGWDAHGACALGYWPLVGPSLLFRLNKSVLLFRLNKFVLSSLFMCKKG